MAPLEHFQFRFHFASHSYLQLRCPLREAAGLLNMEPCQLQAVDKELHLAFHFSFGIDQNRVSFPPCVKMLCSAIFSYVARQTSISLY